jgi:hypothetical protein
MPRFTQAHYFICTQPKAVKMNVICIYKLSPPVNMSCLQHQRFKQTKKTCFLTYYTCSTTKLSYNEKWDYLYDWTEL